MLILFLFFLAFGHECIHDEIAKNAAPPHIVKQDHVFPRVSGKREVSAEERFTQPFRIVIDTNNLEDDPYTCYKVGDPCKYSNGKSATCVCRDGDVLTSTKRILLNKLLAQAKEFYENTFAVLPLANGLKVRTSLQAGKDCDDVRFSPDYADGIHDGEFLLFVTSRPIQGQTVIATAKYCQVDDLGRRGGRPTVGIMNIQPLFMTEGVQFEPGHLGVVLHEISHAMGFSPSKFYSGFIRWTGPDSYVDVEDILFTYDKHPRIGHKVQRIITPNVRDAVRAHFNCPTMDGGEIEDAGPPGTQGSHWDKRVYQNEYMTGISSPYPAYSNITMSLFKDMGWYGIRNQPNAPLLWGRNMGCDFCDAGCDKWPSTAEKEGYHCGSTDPREQCSWDLRGWGNCNSENPSALDEPGCWYYQPQANTYCNADTKLIGFTLPTGEKYGEDSRCFHSTLVAIPKLSNFLYMPQAPYMHCYQTTCLGPKQLKIAIDSIWYDCPYQGGSVHPVDYGGQINCPAQAADLICHDAKVDDTWPVFGRVTPTVGKLGDKKENGTMITIQGKNFLSDQIYVTIAGVNCSEVTIVDSFTITAVLPTSAEFTSFRSFGPFSSRASIVIHDSGRTAVGLNAFQLNLDPNGDDIFDFFHRKIGVDRAGYIAIVLSMIFLCTGSCIAWGVVSYCRQREAQKLQYQPLALEGE